MNVSETLRLAVEQSGMTRYVIAKETGIAQSMLSRFVTGRRGLSLDAVDRLSAFLKLELVSRAIKRGKAR
jgi:transcriptional regulator with XRE-family HTH domain